jgi:hypothetical protein
MENDFLGQIEKKLSDDKQNNERARLYEPFYL